MKGRTKTPYSVCVGTKNLYPIYRVVWAYKGHFYIRHNGKDLNVDREINERQFTYTENLR